MFIILLALASVFNGCSVWPDDTFYIISTPGEQIEIRLNEIFRNSMNKQYKVIPSSPLYSILTPLTLIQKSQYNSQEPREILAQKLYKSSGFMDLSNQMTILSKVQNNYFIEYNSILFEYTPDIDVVKLLNVKPNSICYDTVQVDQKYVVECNDADGDYFAILSQDQTQFFTIQNSQRQQRKLDQLDNLILRNLYYSLELYQVQDDGIVLLSTLNTQYLRLLTKDDEFTLLVVDFQFHTNSQITILNQKGQFISLKYIIQSQKWELYEYLQTETTLPYAYDFSWKYLQLVIISENTLYLRSLSDWTVNGKLTIEPKDKVFLTQNYIILQKEKSLYILNQYLKQIQTLQTQTQGFLISYQAYDQFTLFDKQYFQTYAVDQANEQILKFQSNQLTDDYTMFTIQQQLFYTICQIKCYYKVVDVKTKDIYQQISTSNSFFRGGVLLDDPQSLQYTQPFAGQNLQLEFTPNKILSLKFNRHQQVEIIGTGDPKEVVYRKFIPESGQTSFIEQQKNSKITGYICNLKDTQFQCKTFIQTQDFIKLQDSPLQTWFAEFYTYLAVAKDKNIELYCNCNDLFQISLFKTLTMDTNIKEIKHSHSYLLILVQNEVLVYQINNIKQRLIYRHLAEKVFTSQNQDLVWIYEKKTLYLFDISDNSKLVWLTYLKDYDDIEIGIAQNYFLLLTKRNNQYQGFVYNYKYLKTAYIAKELDLTGYTQLKICSTCNQNSNFVYLDAQKNGNQILLAYRLDQIAINSQFLEFSIQTGSQISTSEQNLFITDSNSQQFQQYIIHNKDTFSLTVSFNKNYQQIKSCETIMLDGKVFNSEKNLEIKQVPISLINRGVELFARSKELNYDFKKDDKKTHCFDLGQSWYSGQAFDIELQQPFGDITYEKTLIKQKESIESSQSIMEFDKNNLVQLMNNGILLISKEDFKITEFKLDNQYTFTNILYIKDNLIYVQAIINQQYLLKIIQYKDLKLQLIDGQMTTDSKIRKMYFNLNYVFLWVGQDVQVYEIKKEPLNLQDYTFIQKVTRPFVEGSMEFQYYQKNDVYLILYFEENCVLYVYSFDLKQSQNAIYNQFKDVAQILREKLFYDPQNLSCRNMFQYKNELVFVIAGSPSYKFSFEVEITEKTFFQILQFDFISEFQQYGISQIDNQYPNSFLNENVLSVVYKSNDGYDLLLYDLLSENNNIGPKLAIAHLSIEGQQRQITSLVYSYNESLHLLSSTENNQKWQHYLLKRTPQICTDKASVKQDVKFLLKNTYQEKVVSLNLKITSDIQPDPIPDEKKGFPLWATLTIIGTTVLLVGIGITIWCYKKKKPTVDTEQLIP